MIKKLTVLVSGIPQGDSVIYASIAFQILFPRRQLQNIKQSSLCCTVGPCWSSILNTAMRICQTQAANLSLPPATIPLTGNCKVILFLSVL